MIISSPLDFRAAAKRKLPRFLFDYIDGGANQELTLRRNTDDLASVWLNQRVMSGTDAPKLETRLLGAQHAMPIVLGPVGLSGMFARRGEAQAARAARQAGIPFCLSTVSVCSIEEVQAAGSSLWFQLYILRDRHFMKDLIARIQQAGCNTLVLTVDMPVPGARYRDYKSGMRGPRAPLRRYLQSIRHPRWTWDVALRGRPLSLGNLRGVLGASTGLEDYMGWLAANFDPALRWSDLEWLRQHWGGSIVIKGILHPDDARMAMSLGADALVVSNHGGRQLDGALSPARTLSSIANAVGEQILVLADSGIRSGVDVIKMLTLGAKGVLIGRLWAYALAARGEAGVTRLLRLIEAEMRVTMTLAGITDVNSINPSVLAETGWN